MKQNDKTDIIKKIEQARESMVKRLYEIKKIDNPKLDWKKFTKNFDNMRSKDDAELKNKIFREEIDKIIQNEKIEDNIMLLNEIKNTIDFSEISDSSIAFLPDVIAKGLKIILKFIAFYLISVILFGLFSYFVKVNLYCIFLLSLITSTLFMLCETPSHSISAFIYDPFLTYKLAVIYIIIMVFVNENFYRIFNESLIWVVFIPLGLFLHTILGRNIHKLWWRY